MQTWYAGYILWISQKYTLIPRQVTYIRQQVWSHYYIIIEHPIPRTLHSLCTALVAALYEYILHVFAGLWNGALVRRYHNINLRIVYIAWNGSGLCAHTFWWSESSTWLRVNRNTVGGIGWETVACCTLSHTCGMQTRSLPLTHTHIHTMNKLPSHLLTPLRPATHRKWRRWSTRLSRLLLWHSSQNLHSSTVLSLTIYYKCMLWISILHTT